MYKCAFISFIVLILRFNSSYSLNDFPNFYTTTIDWQNAISSTDLATHSSNIIVTVLNGMHLEIVLKNVFSDYIRCGYAESNDEIMATKRNANSRVIHIHKIIDIMSTTWWCTAHDMIKIENIYFEIKVKGKRNVGVTVNGESLKFTKTNLEVPQYDGVLVYQAERYQHINVMFNNLGNVFWKMHFDFHNASGAKIDEYEGTPHIPVDFNMVIEPDKHYSYIDCTMSHRPQYKQTFVYRVIFKVKENLIPDTLSKKRNSPITTHVPDAIACKGVNGIRGKPPVIQGLPKENILYKENTTQDMWQAVYTYKANESVKLTCITTGDRKPQWVVQKKEKTVVYINKGMCNSITNTFTLKAKDNETKIVCESKEELDPTNIQMAVITLRQKPEPERMERTRIYTTATTLRNDALLAKPGAITNNRTSTGMAINKSHDLSPKKGHTVIIACVAIVIAAVLIAGIVVFYCIRCRKPAEPKSAGESLVLEDDTKPQALPRKMVPAPIPYDYVYNDSFWRRPTTTQQCVTSVPPKLPHRINSESDSQKYYEIP